jgi:hypothetical protein
MEKAGGDFEAFFLQNTAEMGRVEVLVQILVLIGKDKEEECAAMVQDASTPSSPEQLIAPTEGGEVGAEPTQF